MSPGGLKSPVTPIWRGCRPRTFASGVLSPLGPWIAATGRRQRTPPFRPPGPSPGGSEVCRWPRCGAPQRPALGLRGRAVGAAAHARSATCRRPSAGRPAADCITPRRCKVAGADGSAANEMPSERVGQPRPGAARTRRGTRGASQATCARVCGTAASLHRHHAARHGCRGGGLGGAHIRRSDQPRTAHAGSSSRGAGAHNGAQEARGHLHVLRSAPAAGCREPGASPLRARPPGRLQARAPAARGLSGEPEGVGRLRTSDAALCWALCHFRAAVAACGHGGRAAAAGGQHTRVCRRIRCPFLVLCARTSWLSKRYPNPPSQERPLPKDHTAAARSAPAPFRTATGAGI